MTRICPSCGTRAVDDQSQYCNKCGYPFPKDAPRPAPVISPPGARTTVTRAPAAAPPAPAPAGVRHPPARPAGRPPAGKGTGGGLPFRRLLGRKIRGIYLVGAIAIILIAILGILPSFSPGASAVNSTFTNTTALVQEPATSPLFWILVLVFGSIVWRLFCELVGVVIWMYTAIREEEGESDEDEGESFGGGGAGKVRCPKCGKVVDQEDLRECEHCGVQGCSSCIRKMGLVRKTMTCRECFEGK